MLSISVDGAFGYETKSSVESYQRTYGLPVNGIVDRLTWDYIQNSYYSFLESLDYRFSEGVLLPFPGRLITPGVSGEDVLALQKYLNYIAQYYPTIPIVTIDGIYGEETVAAVDEFKRLFGIPSESNRVSVQIWDAITDVYDDLYNGGSVNDGQYPGYNLGE